MEVTKQQIQNVIQLLGRVQLTGNEVPAFNELVKLFEDEYKKQSENQNEEQTETKETNAKASTNVSKSDNGKESK